MMLTDFAGIFLSAQAAALLRFGETRFDDQYLMVIVLTATVAVQAFWI